MAHIQRQLPSDLSAYSLTFCVLKQVQFSDHLETFCHLSKEAAEWVEDNAVALFHVKLKH